MHQHPPAGLDQAGSRWVSVGRCSSDGEAAVARTVGTLPSQRRPGSHPCLPHVTSGCFHVGCWVYSSESAL